MRASVVLSCIVLCACGGSTAAQHGSPDGGDARAGAESGSDVAVVDGGGDGSPHRGHDAAGPNDTGVDAPADTGPLTLSDACFGIAGLTGQSVLDDLRAKYSATYTPIGAGSPTALTITTSYMGGAVTCIAAEPESGHPASISVDVQIGFSTADGEFAEAFTTPVSRSAGGTTLQWDGVLAASAIKGTYKPTLSGKTVDLSFGGTFVAATTSGLVEQQATTGGGGSVAGAGTWK